MSKLLEAAALGVPALLTACGTSGTTNTEPGDAAVRTDDGGASGTSDDAGANGDAGASACVGRPGVLKGKTDRTVKAAGVSRTYVLYEPEGIDPNAPVPLVLVFHGMMMSGQEMFDITEYSALADSEKFVVAFPNGEPLSVGPWNVGKKVCPPGDLVDATGNDLAFLDAVIADVQADTCIDRRHTFVTGFSMGGFFSHDVGCVRPDIPAIAVASGGTHPFASCAPGHKPVIIFHGTADKTIPQKCDDTARAQWVQKNGCSTTVTTTMVQGGHCEWSQGCPKDGQVVYCLFDGMAHAWAGGRADAGAYDSLSSAPNYASATQLSWSFFKSYAF
jgi:polyhydroxybutyrate depolymerase